MTTAILQKWNRVKLGDVAEIESGGTPSSAKPEYWDGGDICWATLPDLENKYLFDTQRKITPLGLKNSSAKLLPINSVIFSSRATIGEVAITKVETSTNQGSKNFICDPTKVDYEFLYYLLKSKVEEITNLASGATYKEINKTVFSGVEVEIPNIPVQKQIAQILAIYDDLIYNNTRRIQILEQIAQAVYTEWFINFRFLDHKKVKMIESSTSFGKIPERWRVVTLSELFTNVRNSTPSGEILNKRPYVPIDVIDSQTLSLRRANSWTEAQSSLMLFEKGDVLFGAMRPYFHKVAIAPFAGVTRGTCFVLRPKHELAFCALTIFQKEVIDFTTANSQGATIPYINWGVLSGKNCVLPPAQVIADFSRIVQPMLELSQKLADTNEQLSNSRNLLLPKLVTGEIKI